MHALRPRFLVTAVLAVVCAAPAGAVAPIEQLEPPRAPGDTPADTPAAPGVENEWSRGVPEAQRQAAEALFYEGNRLMRESITLTAAAKYREALTHWDHPNIHYNLSVALMTLDQPVETYEHLQQATKYGPKPLEQERYEHARNYITLLEKQLVHAKIRCAVPEATVELDGKQLFTTPGEFDGLVRAGRHTLVARREGYVTNQSVRMWEGGRTADVDLELKTAADLTVTTRRWAAWKPWALVGVGAAAVGAGVYLQYTGADKIHTVDQKSLELCPSPDFCPDGEPAELAKMREEGERMQKGAVIAYAAGGAALVTGVVLVFMNRGETHVRSYDSGESQPEAPPAAPKVEVSPVVTPDAPGLSVLIRF
jgi:hypothetical protein